MNTYLAESREDGIEFTHAFDAESLSEAERIASRYGWAILYALADEDDGMYFELKLETASVH